MVKSLDIARELYDVGRKALEEGNTRVATLLICTALISIGKGDARIAELRDAVLLGFKPESSEVEALLDELGKHINVGDEIVIELNIKKILLAISGLVLSSIVYLATLPPWLDAILIPGAAVAFTLAFILKY